ncbi:MAG: ABC transporter substrate-binding protein [Xenococcus sp. (in: cyanobacteria)]
MQTPRQPRSKKLSIIAAIIVIAVLGISALAWWYRNQRNQTTGKLQKVTIAQFGDFFLYAPLYVAIDAGFFEKNGLDVSLVSTGGDEKTWAAVFSKSASFGVADPTFIAIAESRGQPGKVIANVVNGVPFWGVTLDPNIKVQEPKDLNDYSVATLPAPSTAYTLQRDMFLDGGLKPNIRQGAFGTLLAQLRAKQVDIALELEPNVSQAVTDGASIAYSLGDVFGDFAITGFTVTPKLLEEQPELAENAVCSLQMALDFIRKDKEAALKILEKRFPEVKKEVATAALDRVIKDGIIPEDVATGEAAWDKAIALRQEVGDIENPKSFETYVDNKFAEKALKDCRLE